MFEYFFDGVVFVYVGVVMGKFVVDWNDVRNFRLSVLKVMWELFDVSVVVVLNALAASGGAYRIRASSNFASGRFGLYVMVFLLVWCVLVVNLVDVLMVYVDD